MGMTFSLVVLTAAQEKTGKGLHPTPRPAMRNGTQQATSGCPVQKPSLFACGAGKCLMRVDRVDRVDRVAMPWQCLEVAVRHEVASCIDASNLRIPPREKTSRCADLAHNFCRSEG